MSNDKLALESFQAARSTRFFKAHDRSQDLIDHHSRLEDYQLGRKPWKVRVINTNRVNSILNMEGLSWRRVPLYLQSNVLEATEITRLECTETSRRYDYPSRSYKDAQEDVVYVYGQLTSSDVHRSRNTTVKLTLDDGTDVTKSIPREAKFEVLLDCKEPTVLYSPDAGLAKITFTDRFGEVIKAKDAVVFMSKETLQIGNVVRFYPRGGMMIKTIEGRDYKVMNPHVTTVMKIDSKLPDRVMLAKLRGGK